jgi:N-acetylneuraminate lyase
MMRSGAVFLVGCAQWAVATVRPEFMVLTAPWTPFHPDGSLNVDVVPQLAASAAESGANTVWVGGGMAQFYALTISERKALFKAWMPAAKAHNLYTIAHVGTTVQAEAMELAELAVSLDADSIASVPSYYAGTTDIPALVDWFKPIAGTAPKLPFYYYHIPADTHVSISMLEFSQQAKAGIPTFAGVKFVDTDDKDFLDCVMEPGLKDLAFMWAPEPKLQSFAFPGKGTILAESFYAGTFLRMWGHFNSGNMKAAREEQQWKYTVNAVFTKYGGTNAKRAVYKAMNGFEMGVDRAPASQQAPSPTQFKAMVAELTALSFFNQTFPKWAPPAN